MKRVFLYIRVSTEEQAIHGLSIEAQTAALEAWARNAGNKVVGIYTDAGISARKPASKRPALQQLLADVRAGKGELVAFTKLDRWFRNIAEYYKVQEVLEQHHVDWKTIQEDYDTSNAAGRLKINIMLSVAQDEADRTSERIKAVFDAKRERREPLTGNAPTGYRIAGKKLVKDERTEKAVDAFFRRFLASGSVSEAQAHVLETCRFPIEYPLAVKMLANPAYRGFYYGVEGMCPPYISRAEFEKIQAMRERTVRKTKEDRVYLFSGLLVCGACGRRMGGRTNTRGGTPFYNCPNHYVRKTCGSGVNLSEAKIEARLLDALEGEFASYRMEFRGLRDGRGRNYSSEIAAVKAKLSRLKELYLNQLLSLEEYRRDREPLQTRLAALSEEAAGETRDFGGVEAALSQGWRAAYQGMDRGGRRDFWRVLLREVRVFPDRSIGFDWAV